MAGRPPAPCGTMAAVRRHKRKEEELDDECLAEYRRYEREQKQAQRSKYLAEQQMEFIDDGNFGLTVQGEELVLDEVRDLMDNYVKVTETMSKAYAKDIAPLSKRRQELAERIIEIQKAQNGEGDKPMSKLDEIAARRERRQAGA